MSSSSILEAANDIMEEIDKLNSVNLEKIFFETIKSPVVQKPDIVNSKNSEPTFFKREKKGKKDKEKIKTINNEGLVKYLK